MAQFEVFEDGVEVNGQTVSSMLAAAGELSSVFEKRMRETLEENGISDPQPDEWYSQQAYLDSFATVSDMVGPQSVTNIGKKIPENAEWPPGIDSVSAGLSSVNDAYQMNHQGGDIGSYEFEETAPSEGTMTCRNPYPCDFDRGIVQAVAEKFSPEGSFVDVTEDSHTCRNDGGTECVYHVSW